MRVPTGTSLFLSRNVALVVALTGGVFWVRGAISGGWVIAAVLAIHLLARYVSEHEPERQNGDPA